MMFLDSREWRRIGEDIEAIKWRQWILLPAVPITGAGLVVTSISTITGLTNFAHYQDDDGISFSFYELSQAELRSKVITNIALQISLLVASWASYVHFLLFFHRDNSVYRRAAIQTVLLTTVVVLAALMKVTGDKVATLPLIVDMAIMNRSDVTTEQLVSAYHSWRDSVITQTSFISFLVSVVVSGFHIVVILFWVWLLPSRYRLPNNYVPVVKHRKWRTLAAGKRIDPSYELVETTDSAVSGQLNEVYQEHEQSRRDGLNNSSTKQQKALQVVSITKTPPTGPQFEPIVRYWMLNPLRSGLWVFSAMFLVFFTFSIVFETVFYILTRAHDLRCEWDCYLSFVYPYPVVLWASIIAVLLRLKIPFNRRAFGGKGPRLDVLVTIAALPFIPVFVIVHIARFASFGTDGTTKYENYIESDPGRESAYGVIAALKIIELAFAIITGLCQSLLIHTIYKFYKQARRKEST
ncbi:hypothetical protein F5Y18DRAFT_333210 [Xylariaceae sp. FL1019]|nr:hypothetical protein F5Y18DRAFT_333210 [Xylariaceae sp. FL1019]